MKIKAPLLLALGLASLFLAGCLRFGRHRHSQATSVMQFLYPQNSQHLDAPGIPILSLPIFWISSTMWGASPFSRGTMRDSENGTR